MRQITILGLLITTGLTACGVETVNVKGTEFKPPVTNTQGTSAVPTEEAFLSAEVALYSDQYDDSDIIFGRVQALESKVVCMSKSTPMKDIKVNFSTEYAEHFDVQVILTSTMANEGIKATTTGTVIIKDYAQELLAWGYGFVVPNDSQGYVKKIANSYFKAKVVLNTNTARAQCQL